MRRERDEFPEPPPGEGQQALLGVIGGCAQHQARIDQHGPAGQSTEVAIEDEMLADAGSGIEIASQSIDIGAVETKAVEGRAAGDLAIARECSLVRIDP